LSIRCSGVFRSSLCRNFFSAVPDHVGVTLLRCRLVKRIQLQAAFPKVVFPVLEKKLCDDKGT
jgi:hypothetical protein